VSQYPGEAKTLREREREKEREEQKQKVDEIVFLSAQDDDDTNEKEDNNCKQSCCKLSMLTPAPPLKQNILPPYNTPLSVSVTQQREKTPST
jgi:hypothetical protein